MSAKIKKITFTILLSGLSMWAIAGLWHNLILPSFYEDSHATHEGIGLMLFAYLILAGFMAFYIQGYSKKARQ
jgi:hypothetical protein|tara:strand:+ start:278 stop:496 length:219 start_codon:yes stop_codon:yes gene_type:complete